MRYIVPLECWTTTWIPHMAAATARPRPQLVTLTPAAVARLRAIMASKGKGFAGLRIGVEKGGCAGMEYTMSWASERGKFDEVVEQDGATVLIDPGAVLYLIGSEIDFKEDKISSQFVFRNPNQKSACGCGESVEIAPAPKGTLEDTKV
jgi:iron-sulfur cluster assembly protein